MARDKPEEFEELIIGDCSMISNKKSKRLKNGEVVKYFVSKIRPFSNSGAYIPCSRDYLGHKVYVVVLEDKND